MFQSRRRASVGSKSVADPMQIEIIPKTDLTEKQTQALSEMSRAVYPPNPDATPNSIQWAATTSSVLVWDKAGDLVSHVGLLARRGTVNDSPVLIGGIGGVKTHPTARRRGYARAGIDHAIEFLRAEQAVDFSLLVCRDELASYYVRLGWHHFTGELLVDQRAGKEPFTFNEPMVLAGCREIPAEGVIDLRGMPW